ncbi:pro-sigmaK processing inhibitor BofA family protein [Paenibacillus sp. UNC499MF]|uniref:pro-sigmaK processing inhibitor BofA family protein n=1 Tax=Paenibacillus sp. UNC499MF TaxID=1502751 RepID=UPI0008A095B8|nr:pro-sigmaK processing inhibitor BofA family protein [Paenibacillus sp. UNC499MF]SEG76949.1 inhibitor of the pro-sigma K processing machinery [Paenibacillus sp. UNC499MF]
MKTAVWGMLALSAGVLLFMLVRQPGARRIFSSIGVHVVVAAFLLYGVQLLSGYTGLELPINIYTVGTVSVLGVPGLMLLTALKVVLV